MVQSTMNDLMLNTTTEPKSGRLDVGHLNVIKNWLRWNMLKKQMIPVTPMKFVVDQERTKKEAPGQEEKVIEGKVIRTYMKVKKRKKLEMEKTTQQDYYKNYLSFVTPCPKK